MGTLMQSHDWASTSLGRADHWPQSLRTIVSIVLNSRSPLFTLWGPQHVVLYNDSFRAFLGQQHPWALGRPSSEIWPAAEFPLAQATGSKNALVSLSRSDEPAIHFSVSCIPVQDENGGVGGLLCTYIETIQPVSAAITASQVNEAEEPQTLTAPETVSICVSQALENMGDAFIALDRGWHIIYQNAASEQIKGKSHAEVLGKTLWEEWPAAVNSDLEVQYRQAVSQQKPVYFEHCYCEPPDLEIWLEIRAYPHPDGLNIFLRDISEKVQLDAERKQAELAIREQNEILRLFVKYVPSGVAMFDRQMRYLMASQRWIDDFDFGSFEAVEGRSLHELFPETPELWKLVHQQCLAGANERCNDVCFERQDSSQQWIRWEVRPWYRPHHSIGGIVIFSEDITEYKQAKSSIQQQQTQLQQQQLAEIGTIYRLAPIGLSVLDQDLRFVRINQQLAEINGFSIEDHIGRTMRELSPDLADQVEAVLRPILETGELLLNVEVQGKTPAQPGVQRTWLWSFSPLKVGDCVIGISTVCQEITEAKQLEVEHQQALAGLATD